MSATTPLIAVQDDPSRKMSSDHAWWVAGIDADGRGHALSSFDEAEVVALFWFLVDSLNQGHVSFYADSRTLWLDEHTSLVEMGRVSLVKARRSLRGPTE